MAYRGTRLHSEDRKRRKSRMLIEDENRMRVAQGRLCSRCKQPWPKGEGKICIYCGRRR